MRLPLAGINGPHAADPSYNPQQTFHIHAGVTIYVDSQKVTIPVFTPEPEHIHTHDATGTIHIHPFAPRTSFVTLNDVFESWRTAESGGNPDAVVSSTNLLNHRVDTEHSLRMFVNGSETDAFERYQIHDKDQILLVYGTNPIVTLDTNQGPLVVELFEDMTPGTVNNFLTYVNSGAYDGSIFHRFVPGFVLQGGGFESSTPTFTNPSQITSVPANAAIVNEFDNWSVTSGTGAVVTEGSTVIQLPATADLSRVVSGNRIRLAGRTDGASLSNMFDIVAVNDAANTVTVSPTPSGSTSGNVTWTIFPRVNVINTLAMAKVGGDPHSATNQFFVNLSNNDSNLDLQNGGFTVFARVFDVAQPRTSDSSTAPSQLLNGSYTSFVTGLTTTNAGNAFSDLPLATGSQLVTLESVIGDGEVKGIAFSDLDGNGIRGSGETGRSGVTVFADINNNQQLDPNEESTTTDVSGNYTLRLEPGLKTIRIVPVNATTQSTPAGGYTVTVQVGRDVTGRDFGLTTLAAPTGIDLLDATDSGSSSTDNATNFNNSSGSRAPRFRVSGVLPGATVQLLSDGSLIGEASVPAAGGDGTIVVTANGSTLLSDGIHLLTAAQTLNGVTGTMAASSGLSLRVDTAGPQFTSAAPLLANVGIPFSYSAETNEEGSGAIYSMVNAPTGASVNVTTGVVNWTPTASQLGAVSFSIVATDSAGNATNQAVSLTVAKPPQVRVRLAVTNLSGTPITAINVGDLFQVRGFVSDVRTSPSGVLALYQDITWNGSVASAVAGSFVYGDRYNQSSSGAIAAGLLDEIGASANPSATLGGGEYSLFQVNLRADAEGSLAFVGSAADLTPAHQVTLFGGGAAVPMDEIDFGQTAAIQVRRVAPGSLAGFVYVDANNNGLKETGEQPMDGVTITLTGSDSFGATVSRTATTGADGSYKFENLNPGNYRLKETQPTGLRNNLPILDGQDTVGSQGGTVSANDELSIVLAEGINGIRNNFAERIGYTFGGHVAIDESPGAGNANAEAAGLAFIGIQISLFSTDSQQQPVGNPLQTTQVAADGTFAFAGLPTGAYVTNVPTPIFLANAAQNQLIQVGSNSETTQVTVPAARQARYISYRDYMNSSATRGVFAALATGATQNVWAAFDSSWSGFRDLSLRLTNDGNSLRIDASTAAGTAAFAEVPVNDPRVRVVGQEGTTRLFRLSGSAAEYSLTPGNPATSSSLRIAASSDSTESPASDLLDESVEQEMMGEGEALARIDEPAWMPSAVDQALSDLSFFEAWDLDELDETFPMPLQSIVGPTTFPA